MNLTHYIKFVFESERVIGFRKNLSVHSADNIFGNIKNISDANDKLTTIFQNEDCNILSISIKGNYLKMKITL